MIICLSSAYLSFFVWVLFLTTLFFFALRFSRGEVRRLVFLVAIINLIMLLTLPLLFSMTKGVCAS